MAGTYGINQSKAIVVAAAQLGECVEQVINVLSQGGLLAKLKIVSVILSAAPAVQILSAVDYTAFVAEVKDYDAQEEADLLAAFKAGFNLDNKNVETTIDEVLEVVMHSANLVQQMIEQVKTILSMFKK